MLARNALRAIGRRPLEIESTIYQIESLGVRSLGIVAVTSVLIGMVADGAVCLRSTALRRRRVHPLASSSCPFCVSSDPR